MVVRKKAKRGRKKGTPKTGGRKKGSRNKATIEGKEFARSIISDLAYRKNLKKRARAGELQPQVEAMIWYYAFGKPIERIEESGPDGGPVQHVTRDLSKWSPDDFKHARRLARKLDDGSGD